VPGAVCEDPRFIGGDGNTFYFHGRRDRDFCLLSDANLHINGHFIGSHVPGLTRDPTWVQAIAVQFSGRHRLYVGARRTAVWDDAADHLSTSSSTARPCTSRASRTPGGRRHPPRRRCP
jgi:hypothetical protein